MKERIEKMKNTKKKGFTLVELLVVIAIMAILALIAVPNFSGYIDKSRDSRIQSDLKTVYSAAIVSIEDSDEIKLDDAVVKNEIFNESIKSLVNFSSEIDDQQYYDRYKFFNKQNQLVVEYEDVNGKKHYYPKEVGMIGGEETGENEDPNYGNEYLATDEDFTWVSDDFIWIFLGGESYTATNETERGFYKYIGDKTTVKIPHEINGHPMTSYYGMFAETSVEQLKVISDNSDITDMSFMFYGSQATSLDLSSFNTSKVTNMNSMFYGSKATTLDLSSFDTSNVTNMRYMFRDSQATSLDLSSFDTSNVTRMDFMFYGSQAISLDLSNFNTSNVTDMWGMFRGSQATSLDLSSFNTSNVTNMRHMFQESKATTLDLSSFDTSKITNVIRIFQDCQATTGYARTQADADRFNSSSPKPSGLNFIVK